MSTVLTVEDIHASIEGVPILRGVDLELESNETVALLGPNGAGKTTTFNSILGTVTVTQGTITLNGTDISSLPTHKRVRRGIGISPEDRRLFTELSVRDNIKLSMTGSKESIDEANVESTLEHIYSVFPDVEKFVDRKAKQLSGGQQQMVAVSRVLASGADTILLDEPFEGLAPTVRHNFREGVKRLEELNKSLLIAESNVVHAEKVADRLYLIERGEIVGEIDSTDDLRDNEMVTRLFTG